MSLIVEEFATLASPSVVTDTYDCQKEMGAGHHEKKIQYRGPTHPGSRSSNNGWKASDLRRRLDRHSQGSRRTDIRNIISNYDDNLEELSQEDLPLSVRSSIGATGGYSTKTSTSWYNYQTKSNPTIDKEIVDEEDVINKENVVELDNLSQMSDAEILQLALKMSQVEY